jgi:hypothetical protein
VNCGQNSTACVRARMPASLWRERVSADRMSRVATSTTTSLRLHCKLQRALGSRRVSHWPAWAAPYWQISPRGDLAIQVPATPAGEVRRYVKSVGILAGIRHRYYGSVSTCYYIKTRTYDCLKKHGANWVNELSSVLWGNWTTPSRASRETPFFLVYGAKACLPPEILMGSPRVQSFDESMQEQLRREDVDFIDERK